MQTLEKSEQFVFEGLHEALLPWQPTRAAGLAMLQQFLPKAGRIYQAHRNEDSGSGKHFNVSRLSPYLRRRLLSEQELLATVLSQHGASDAFKFVQEVFWRSTVPCFGKAISKTCTRCLRPLLATNGVATATTARLMGRLKSSRSMSGCRNCAKQATCTIMRGCGLPAFGYLP